MLPGSLHCKGCAKVCEYATDVMFKSRSVMSFGSEQVLRFLQRADAKEAKTDRRRGPDGVRVKLDFSAGNFSNAVTTLRAHARSHPSPFHNSSSFSGRAVPVRARP
jgi:hypothetical protein